MLEFKGAKHAAIIYLTDLSIIARSPNFVIKNDEIKYLIEGFSDIESIKRLGIKINGKKHHIIDSNENLIYGTRLEPIYLVCMKTIKFAFILIGDKEPPQNKFKAKSNETFKVNYDLKDELFIVKSEGALDAKSRFKTRYNPFKNPENDSPNEIFEPRVLLTNADSKIPIYIEEMQNLGDHLLYYHC